MKYVQKTRIQKKHFIALILAVTLVAALAVSIIVSNLKSDAPASTPVSEQPSVIEGEARQSGLALAYPAINKKLDISFINVKNQTGEFGFMVYPGDSYHTLFYVDPNGDQVVYYPDICATDPSFKYSSLFAIETGDGYSRYTLVDYLCISLQSPYFDVRVPFETDPEKKAAQFEEFGFSGDNVNTVFFAYENELGESVERTVKIGASSVTGTGYYFIVSDNGVERPYIYSSLNNYYKYAISGMNEFIKPLIVSDGLAEDSGYGPYLTTGYYQWLNRFHDGNCECDKYTCECRGECEVGCGCSDTCRVTDVKDESRVVVYADTIAPIISEDPLSIGYESTGYKVIEIDLAKYAEQLKKLKDSKDYKPSYESKNYERAIKALVGKSIGEYDSENEIIYSFVLPRKLIDFADKTAIQYEYRILAIESILTDDGEITKNGVKVGDECNLVKVTYTASVDGKAISSHPMHAVLDLSGAAIDPETVSSIRNSAVGDTTDIAFTVSYTTDNAVVKNSKYVITEIIDIFDSEGKETDTVTDNSIVGYRYEVYVDGTVIGEASYWLDLSEVTEGEDLEIKKSLIGKKMGRVTLEFEERSAHYEYFLDFNTYKLSRIDYFVTRELVSAFKFQNNSERDPYYGESLYENLMDDEHKLYGLSAGVCETVVKILGGISEESATATAAGLTGDKAIAIGLSPEVMKKYGLYAHTVYFELPRGIKAYDPGNTNGNETLEEQLDDYTYRSVLGFTLYISDVDPETNTRYIASDQYNVVTRVAADDFVFLKYDFETFWARRNMILMDIAAIGELGIEFCMTDLKGNYNFELTQPKNNQDALGVHVTANGECTPNRFTEFVSDPKNSSLIYQGGTSLKTLYLNLSSASPKEHESAYPDSLGASYFKEVIRMIYLTAYVDILPEEVRDEAPDPDSLVMRMTLELDDSTPNASPYIYIYQFYRIDDRRIRVSIHQENLSGDAMTDSISDFYISTFAFKKIVNNFVGLLNAELLDPDVGYPDELK